MGHTLDGTGKPEYNDDATNPGPLGDFQAAVDYAERIGGVLKLSSAERGQLTPSQVKPGWLVSETDTGRIYQWFDGTWVLLMRRPTGWATIDLATGWANQGTYPSLSYRFDAAGNVHVRGQIIPRSNYPSTEVFATLPVGARPSIRLEVPVVVNNQATRGIAGVLIDTNGNMNVTQPGVGAFSFGNTVVSP